MTFFGQLKSPWLWLVVSAWAFLVVAETTGSSVAGDHHALIEGDRWPWGVSLSFFSLFWLVMVAAMMLPAGIPVLEALRGTRLAGGRSFLTAAFLAGYFVVWTGFGAAVFVADTGVHSLTHSWHWLHENAWAVPAATLTMVGLFQLAPSKRRYLEACRQAAQVSRRPVEGWSEALIRGSRYGKCELSCCWALMLLMIAVGHGVAWMLAFTGVMLAERLLPRGEFLARVTGGAVIMSSVVVLALNVS